MASLKGVGVSDDIGAEPSSDQPDYSYGTRLELNEELISALGVSNCKVGDELSLSGVCKVVSKSESESESDSYSHVTLQITDLTTGPLNKDRRGQLYGDED